MFNPFSQTSWGLGCWTELYNSFGSPQGIHWVIQQPKGIGKGGESGFEAAGGVPWEPGELKRKAEGNEGNLRTQKEGCRFVLLGVRGLMLPVARNPSRYHQDLVVPCLFPVSPQACGKCLTTNLIGVAYLHI